MEEREQAAGRKETPMKDAADAITHAPTRTKRNEPTLPRCCRSPATKTPLCCKLACLPPHPSGLTFETEPLHFQFPPTKNLRPDMRDALEVNPRATCAAGALAADAAAANMIFCELYLLRAPKGARGGQEREGHVWSRGARRGYCCSTQRRAVRSDRIPVVAVAVAAATAAAAAFGVRWAANSAEQLQQSRPCMSWPKHMLCVYYLRTGVTEKSNHRMFAIKSFQWHGFIQLTWFPCALAPCCSSSAAGQHGTRLAHLG